MNTTNSSKKRIILGVISALLVAVAVLVAVLIIKSGNDIPEPTTKETTTKPVTTTSPYALLSDIDRNFHKKQIIGRVVSEDMDINCNLVYGTSDDCLSIGAGIHQTSSIPGYSTPPVIAGHCQTVFKGFKNAEVGDLITIKMPYGDYTYRVAEIKVMDRSEFDFAILREPIKQAIFYTCYPFEKVSYVKTDRMFLYCDYVSGNRILDDVHFTVPADVTNKNGELVNNKPSKEDPTLDEALSKKVEENIANDITKIQ